MTISSAVARKLHLCFSKMRRRQNNSSRPPTAAAAAASASPASAAASTLIKNFNSLYGHATADGDLSSSEYDFSELASAVDLSTISASHRFFVSSPGLSNSIVGSAAPAMPPASADAAAAVDGGGIPVPTYSPDPYADFRRSMQEMVEARDLVDVSANWEGLHELLLCFLALNPKSAHKFIIGAFADLIVTLMSSAAVGRSRSRRVNDYTGDGCKKINLRQVML